MSVRNTLVALGLIAGLSGGPAAAAPPGRLGFGGRFGLVGATVTGEGVDASGLDTQARVGPTGALVARWTLGPWSVAGELGMSDRGVDLIDDVDGSGRALHLYYVDIPVLGGFEFDPGQGQVWPSFEAGLMTSILASASGPDEGLALVGRRVDLGLVLGIGASAPTVLGERLSCDVRYVGGLRGLVRPGADGEARVRGHAVSISLGYTF